MAPSGMFSYLRPHHKRTTSASKLTSPLYPSPLYSAESAASSPDFQTHSPLPPRLPRSESPHSNSISPVSPLPPTLPLIPRMASTNDRQGELGSSDRLHAWSAEEEMVEETQAALQTLRPVSRESVATGLSPNAPFAVDKNQINGSRPQTARPTASKDFSGGLSLSRTFTGTPTTYTTAAPAAMASASPSLYSNYSYSANPISGNRSLGSSSAANSNPIPRLGKNKLNLLNPMSLLMRRRANQPAAYLPESSYSYNRNVTLPVPDDYDPRIRGKGVHDFSAPRPRRNIPSPDGENLSPAIGTGRNLGLPYTDESGRGYSTGRDSRLLRVDVGSGFDSDSPIGPRSGEHTPIFREHFGDEISDDETNSKQYRGQRPLGHSGILGGIERPKITTGFIPPPDRSPPPPPPQFREEMPGSDHRAVLQSTDNGHVVEGTTAILNTSQRPSEDSVDREVQDLPGSVDNGPVGAALAESPAYFTGLPKHLKSNASRFSFEVSGMGSSSQERLLEEAHKKTMAKRRSELPKQRQNSFVDDYDDRFDEDGMGDYDDFNDDDDDGGGFEEKIPGVNTDAIEDEYDTGGFEEIPGLNTDAVEGSHDTGDGPGGFDFGSPATGAVGSSAIPFGFSASAVGTPRDADGQPIGFALSKESPMVYQLPQDGHVVSPLQSPQLAHRDSGDGLGLVGVDAGASVDEDELYFDDGVIEHPLEDEEHVFDESVFDDESHEVYGLPLRDLKPPKLRESKHLSTTTNSSPAKYTSEDDEEDSIVPQDSQATDTMFPPMMNPSGNGLGYQASISQQMLSSSLSSQSQSGMGLTQGNLAAYHAALVAAANDAAINGKLSRRDSGISGELGGYEAEDLTYGQNSHPMLVLDSGRVSEEAGNGPYSPNGFYDGMDNFDYDDALEDDPIIAEANADALASDDDGFYGSEFGFYAQAAGSGQAEYVAGGYFGPRNEIMRSTSGRMACREPNLTPITERSECSNRNSFALSMHGPPGQGGIASPGLAQLVGMMGGGVEEDDMSLSTLMKLRRGAWGGSNGSLRSAGSGGSQQQSGSPLTYLQPLGASGSGLAASNVMISSAGGSSISLASSAGFQSPGGFGSEHGASAPASPTITMANYASAPTAGRWGTEQPGLRTSGMSDGSSGSNPGSPLGLVMGDFHPQQPAPQASPKKSRHRREGSGGDSIAYLREEDDEGGERWVLERRRTDEFGEVEIVGREIVEGGRI